MRGFICILMMGMRRKGKARHGFVFATLPRSYSILLPVQHNVDASIFNTTTHMRALSLSLSRTEQTRTTFIISTVFMRHIDLTNAFPFPNPFHTHVPLRFSAHFPLYPTRRLVGLKPAGPRSTSCLVSTLLFCLSQHLSVNPTSHCTSQQDP